MTATTDLAYQPDTLRSDGKSRAPGWCRRALLAIAIVLATATSSAVLAAPAAEASTVRPGARFGQIDILLDGVETKRAATSYWGAQTVCWSVTAAGMAGGVPVAALMNLSCTAVVSVCAAQAYVRGKQAGMTVYPGGFFCWKY